MSAINPEKLKSYTRPEGTPFRIQKIGHVVLNVTDMDRSVKFYTEVLGMKVSDVYKEDMMPGGMVFMRFNSDHHGVALVGGMPHESKSVELNHFAFEVGTLDEVLRAAIHLHKHKVQVDFEGRRRAGGSRHRRPADRLRRRLGRPQDGRSRRGVHHVEGDAANQQQLRAAAGAVRESRCGDCRFG